MSSGARRCGNDVVGGATGAGSAGAREAGRAGVTGEGGRRSATDGYQLAEHAASQPSRRQIRELVNLARPGCNREAMDDDELIASLAGGDDAALRVLFTRHAPWLAA